MLHPLQNKHNYFFAVMLKAMPLKTIPLAAINNFIMIRYKKIAPALLLVISILSFTVVTADWVVFRSHGFVASFPKKPEADSQVINSAFGKLQMNSFMYDASADSTDENLVYGVMATKYPDSLAKAANNKAFIKGFFDGVTKGSVKSVNGKLLSEKDIELDGYPGKEIRVDFQNGLAVIRMRIYMVKTMMFTLQTICYTEKDENKSMYRFLESFSLVK